MMARRPARAGEGERAPRRILIRPFSRRLFRRTGGQALGQIVGVVVEEGIPFRGKHVSGVGPGLGGYLREGLLGEDRVCGGEVVVGAVEASLVFVGRRAGGDLALLPGPVRVGAERVEVALVFS